MLASKLRSEFTLDENFFDIFGEEKKPGPDPSFSGVRMRLCGACVSPGMRANRSTCRVLNWLMLLLLLRKK